MNLRKRQTYRDKFIPQLVVEFNSQRSRTAAASIICGTAAKPQENFSAAMLYGMGNELSYAVCSGFSGIFPLPYHRQAGSGGHLDDRTRTFSAVIA